MMHIQTRKQSGFTLVELIVVIAILAILAALAIPRYVNLVSQARIATVVAMAGSLRAASGIHHAKFLIAGTAPNISNGFGYPDYSATGIGAAVNYSTSLYTFVPGTATTKSSFEVNGATCAATYLQATATAPPVIETLIDGCGGNAPSSPTANTLANCSSASSGSYCSYGTSCVCTITGGTPAVQLSYCQFYVSLANSAPAAGCVLIP